MKKFSHTVDGETLPQARCRYCHELIVEVPGIGWLDPTPGDTYDLCPSSPYGDHQPSDARGDISARLGPRS